MKEHLFFFLQGILIGFLLMIPSCSCNEEKQIPIVRYKGYLRDADLESNVKILDKESFTSLTTENETLKLCFDGDVDVDFGILGKQNLWGRECEIFGYDPDSDTFKLSYNYSIMTIGVDGEFVEKDWVWLSVDNMGQIWLRRQ